MAANEMDKRIIVTIVHLVLGVTKAFNRGIDWVSLFGDFVKIFGRGTGPHPDKYRIIVAALEILGTIALYFGLIVKVEWMQNVAHNVLLGITGLKAVHCLLSGHYVYCLLSAAWAFINWKWLLK